MRRQTQTRRHTTRLPTVARHIRTPRKTAIKIVIGLQLDNCVSSLSTIVALELRWLSMILAVTKIRTGMGLIYPAIKFDVKNIKGPCYSRQFFLHFVSQFCCDTVCKKNGGLPGVLGNKGTWPFTLGNKGTKGK